MEGVYMREAWMSIFSVAPGIFAPTTDCRCVPGKEESTRRPE